MSGDSRFYFNNLCENRKFIGYLQFGLVADTR